jgi:proton glutamate symport protein
MTGAPPPPLGRRGPSSSWAVVALVAGLALGLLGHSLGWSGFQLLAGALKPIGQLWISALLLLVLPLVITTTLASITGLPRGESAGLGVRALVIFVTALAVSGVLTVGIGRVIVEQWPVNSDAVAAVTAATPVPDAARQVAAASATTGLGAWLGGLLPQNLFEAARRGDMLPVLLFALFIGIAITQLPDEHREPLTQLSRAAAAAMLTGIRWMLWFVPGGVFIFTYLFVLNAGGVAAGVVAGFIVFVSAMVLLFVVLWYPVAVVFGRTTLREFQRAVAPAQLVGLSTSSSIASLPALIDGARTRLKLPESSTGFVLPLATSLFKANRTISSTAKLIFLAHIYAIPLSAGTLASFLLTVLILSFSTVGLPGGASAFKTAPAYLAAGIPIEALVITEAAETIPDLFKTLLNVTANMSVAVLLSRGVRAVEVHSAAVTDPRIADAT